MKTIEDKQEPTGKKFLLSRFFSKACHFLLFHLRVLLIFLGAVVNIAILLFLAELIFPKAVHIFNYSMTDRIFTELVKDHRYHAAIAFMETKKDLIEKADEPYIFRQQLADCYIHTGDYPKALEQYRILRKWFDGKIANDMPDNWPRDRIRQFRDFINICFLKEEYRIYLKMGDIANIRSHYGTMKALHETTDWDDLMEFLGEEGGERPDNLLGGIKLEDGFRLELIQGKYLIAPDEAIAEMKEYVAKTERSGKFGAPYRLRLLNELTGMLIERGQRIEGRRYLEMALQIADSMEYDPGIYPQLGDLSEHCRRLNDIESGKHLLKKYLHHIDATYDSKDIGYAVAHALEFRYPEAGNNRPGLVRRVAETSAALRLQIANNFTGMTSAQREHFIEQFRPTLAYANSLMERRSEDALAATCFENNMFLRGLLLRSETAVANAIAALGDKSLTRKYRRFVEASRELVARQYISGPGNYYAKRRLEEEIARLEAEIAASSRDFRRENEASGLSLEQLAKALGKNDIAMQIVEGENTIFALVMDNSGKVVYRPICTKERISRLTESFGAIYVDHVAVKEMFGQVLPLIAGKNVYLSNSGIFNQISFAALPADGEGRVMADISDIHIVGSPTEIPAIKTVEGFNPAGRSAMLWGGVDYGEVDLGGAPGAGSTGVPEALFPISESREILRGDILRSLPNSLEEVEHIARLLRAHGCRTTVVSGSKATEQSFTARSGKKDYILHISTHGFFHDSETFTNPMRNSGLLFADSQRYWTSDSPAVSISEADGILRADEIAGLDLSGCRLVVLSACRTGLGEYNSEGVYGLQRAFKLAGAQSVLMSLRSVDDRAAKELMTEFYNRLMVGEEPGEALASAQRSMRAKGYSPDKWAPFVLLD